MNSAAPSFPGAATALAPLSARLAQAIPAADLTQMLAREALARLAGEPVR